MSLRGAGAVMAAAVVPMIAAGSLHAQEPESALCAPDAVVVNGVHDHGIDYLRLAELEGDAPVRSWLLTRPAALRFSSRHCQAGTGPWSRRLADGRIPSPALVATLPFASELHFNSGYPRSRNNGALWAGRGLNWTVSGGAHLEVGPLSATFAPLLAYQQNSDFVIKPVDSRRWSPWAYAGHLGLIDWPQRHGPEPFWTLDPGQSQISLNAFNVAAGVSTENLWWGPALRNPLLMSNSAPGVPRIFLGTAAPIDIWIGELEFEVFWGRTRESPYYDDDPDNDRALFSGIAVTYQPRPIPGLYVGAARAYMNILPPDGLPFDEWLLRPFRGVRDNIIVGELADNQLLSVFARWAMPAAGFEAWAEWGREDHWADFIDLLSEPDHSQGYTLGIQKLMGSGERRTRIMGELTHLHAASTYRAGRGTGTWYRHSRLLQGYTHRGQLLGAAIGPGSDAQFIGVDVFDRRGSLGLFVERVRWDEDAYYNQWGRYYGMHGHDVEVTTGARTVYFWRDLDVTGQLSWSWRRNRNFIGLDANNWDFRTENNVVVRLGVAWRPGLEIRR
jgi:hypothetical protein